MVVFSADANFFFHGFMDMVVPTPMLKLKKKKKNFFPYFGIGGAGGFGGGGGGGTALILHLFSL